MAIEEISACSINNCPSPATHEETAVSAHWRFVVRYCAEHQRQISLGTPVGPVGIDSSRVDVTPLGAEEPQIGGITPSLSPQ